MAECEEIIDGSAKNASVLSVKNDNYFKERLFKNDDSNLQNDHKKLCKNESADEDIPLVTIKVPTKTEVIKNRMKFHRYHRILQMQIMDILLSDIIAIKPYLYRYKNEEYRNVIISGKITSKKVIKENKITVNVDDGTAFILCVIEDTETKIQNRKYLNNLVEKYDNFKQLSKEELINSAETAYDEDIQANFLNSMVKIIGHITLKSLEKNPMILNISLGDQVTILGNVSDFKDQRLIFSECLTRESDSSFYLQHMYQIQQNKQK